MSYTKTTWNDLTAPAIDATNLNKIEQGIYDNSIDITSINTLIGSSGTATATQTDFTEGQLTQKLGLKYIKMKGQTSQDTYQGYNLLNPEFESFSSNSVTITDNHDGTYTCSGTASADTTFVFKRNWQLTNNTSYRVSGCPSGGGETKYYIYGINFSSMGRDEGSGVSATTGTSAVTLAIRIKSGINTNGLVFKPMVILGTTDKTFEKYVGGTASPNPDFPQDVNKVSGSNVLKVCNKNLYDKDDSSLIMQAFINGAGNAIQGAGTARTLHIPILPNTTYTVSKIVSARFIIGTFESYEIGSVSTQRVITYTNQTSGSITTGANDKYLCVFYYLSTADTLSEETIRNSIQIEVGSTATSFTAHKEEDYEISLSNVVYKPRQWQTSTTTATNYTRLFSTPQRKIKAGSYKLVTNLDFSVFSYAIEVGSSPYPVASNLYDSGWKSASNVSVTLPSGYIGILIKRNNNETLSTSDMDNFTFELRDTSVDDYDIELCKIGDYQDYIYKNNGKWYKHCEVGKKILNGTESWSIANTGTSNFYYQVSGLATPKSQDIMPISDYFIGVPITNSNTDVGAWIISTGTIRLRTITEDTLANFKTWLSTNTPSLYYVLATPTEEEITYEPLLAQLDKLDKIGLYDISNISQDNSDMKMLLDFTICNDNYNGLREFIRA